MRHLPVPTVHTTKGPKRKTFYGKFRAEVAAKLTKALSDRDGGLIFDAGNLALGEYLDRWLTDSLRGMVRTSTCLSNITLANVIARRYHL